MSIVHGEKYNFFKYFIRTFRDNEKINIKLYCTDFKQEIKSYDIKMLYTSKKCHFYGQYYSVEKKQLMLIYENDTNDTKDCCIFVHIINILDDIQSTHIINLEEKYLIKKDRYSVIGMPTNLIHISLNSKYVLFNRYNEDLDEISLIVYDVENKEKYIVKNLCKKLKFLTLHNNRYYIKNNGDIVAFVVCDKVHTIDKKLIIIKKDNNYVCKKPEKFVIHYFMVNEYNIENIIFNNSNGIFLLNIDNMELKCIVSKQDGYNMFNMFRYGINYKLVNIPYKYFFILRNKSITHFLLVYFNQKEINYFIVDDINELKSHYIYVPGIYKYPYSYKPIGSFHLCQNKIQKEIIEKSFFCYTFLGLFNSKKNTIKLYKYFNFDLLVN